MNDYFFKVLNRGFYNDQLKQILKLLSCFLFTPAAPSVDLLSLLALNGQQGFVAGTPTDQSP